MARRKDSPQKAAMREMMRDYLKNNDISIKDGTDVNSIMRDMMSVLLEGALDEELDEELGYSKYDYRNKETDNSRNGHSSKTMHTSYGDMDVAIPRDRNGDYEPQLIKKYQNSVTQDMEEKILSMYAKGMTTGDIESHMRELYDIDISDSTISRITDKILPIGINKRLGPKILVLVKQLERQVVRRVILCRGSLRLYWLLWLGGGSRLRRIRASTGSCRSRSQHLHIVDKYLSHITLDASLVIVRTGTYLTFHVKLIAFMHIFLNDFA